MARTGEEETQPKFTNIADITDEEAAEMKRRANVLVRTDPFLIVCKCFSVVTVISALMCVAVNVISAIYSFKNGLDVFDGILRCYAVVIALFVVVAETEWERILKFWLVLEYWVGRGMLQIFVSVMTKALSNAKKESHVLTLFQEIASYLLLACGVVYVIAGLLCCGTLKRSRLKKSVSREQAAKDLEDLEKRRDELQKLLIDR
ncbi:hypothetical protein KI387_023457, partial [Taxus chinensis]